MFLQNSIKKEEVSTFNSDSDDEILDKSLSSERKEIDLVDLIDSD